MQVEKELHWIICNAVKIRLRKKIKGELTVIIRYDNLYISVSEQDIDFDYTEYNISDKILKGVDFSNICSGFLDQYKKCILSKYFK